MPLILLTACSLPPMRGKAEVGKDPYAVVAADGNGGGDLYALIGAGNEVVQLTFSPLREYAPALSPDGGMLAFLRQPRTGSPSAWVLNLLSGAERDLAMPDSVTMSLSRIAWSSDGQTIYGLGDGGLWRWPAPPARGAATRVPPGDLAAADSALSVMVGDPPFGRVIACGGEEGRSLCIQTTDGRLEALSSDATAPARWGGDSLAWFIGERLEVRPLGGGAARQVLLDAPAEHPTQVTYFRGTR